MLILFEAIAVWLAVVLATMLVVTYLALRWGRDPFGWLLLSAAMGPIAVVALIGTRQSDVKRRPAPAAGPVSQAVDGRRILIACDGSPAGPTLARHVASMPRDGIEAVVLTVLPHEAQPGAHPRSQADYQDRVETAAGQVLTLLREAGIDARSVVAFGVPGEEIVRVAEAEQAALVIIGRRGAGLSRALLGSTSDYVVKHATRPVTVVS